MSKKNYGNFAKLLRLFIAFLKNKKYYPQNIYKSIFRNRYKDEWGRCSCCGKFTGFKYVKYYDMSSNVVQSCQWDEIFTEVINVTNTLDCYFCSAKFRTRCAAESLLKFFQNEKIVSIKDFIKHVEEDNSNIAILETGSTGGVFSSYQGLKNIIKSEYYDDLERGSHKNNIRSEDLQNLTFDSDMFDAVISLDVFEHIPDPWKAFSEVNRVLKHGGIGIITVPIDMRNKSTTRLAKIENDNVKHFRKPCYHLDPLREEGTLVFTDFGTDIVSKLKEQGYKSSFDTYKTKKTNVVQLVILIQKS